MAIVQKIEFQKGDDFTGPLDCFAVGQKARNVSAQFCQPVCRKYGVNLSSFHVLMFLSRNGERNTARDITALRGLSAGLVSVAVETLTERGYLSQIPDPADRRVKRLVPTEKAQPLIREGAEAQRSFLCALVRGVPPEELEVCRRVLDQIVQNVDELDKGEQE